MQKRVLNNKYTLGSLLLCIFVAAVAYTIFTTECTTGSCAETREGVILPLFWFGISASVISSFFLFFNQWVFMSWLKRIASWYLTVLFILTITTPIYSSNIFSVGRSQLVFTGMVVLGITALVYAVIMRSKV